MPTSTAHHVGGSTLAPVLSDPQGTPAAARAETTDRIRVSLRGILGTAATRTLPRNAKPMPQTKNQNPWGWGLGNSIITQSLHPESLSSLPGGAPDQPEPQTSPAAAESGLRRPRALLGSLRAPALRAGEAVPCVRR